ncbi:MAG: MFS transporter [Chloroflexi bacterium]|nr:MFS transporter [Chloroflexota bacterium]
MDEAVTAPDLTQTGERILGFNRNVFFLGLVSFLTDISSEMTLTILPLFLANVLGAPFGIIGAIEGIAESTSSLLKIASGWLSDRVGARKALTALGYGLSTVAKPFLIIASTAGWGMVLGVRVADRVGKGVRTAPRDALVADSSADRERGKNFGFHRAMDTGGAVVGLALAAGIAYLTQFRPDQLSVGTYQTLVGFGILPAVLAVLVILLFVREARGRAVQPQSSPSHPSASASDAGRRSLGFRSLDKRFQMFVVIATIFTLGNSSDAFLILRAQERGLSVVNILIMLVMFNIVYASVAVPAGMLSDRFGRRRVITTGWVVYVLIYLGFALATKSAWQVWVLFVVYGVYYGSTDGVAKALVADLVPPAQRGSAYGVYNAAVGLAVLPASLIAGFLWQTTNNPASPFYFGAALAGLAVALLFVFLRRQ